MKNINQNIKEYTIHELNHDALSNIKSNISNFLWLSFDAIRPLYEWSDIDLSLYNGFIDGNLDRKFVIYFDDNSDIKWCLVYNIKENIYSKSCLIIGT